MTNPVQLDRRQCCSAGFYRRRLRRLSTGMIIAPQLARAAETLSYHDRSLQHCLENLVETKPGLSIPCYGTLGYMQGRRRGSLISGVELSALSSLLVCCFALPLSFSHFSSVKCVSLN